MEAGIKCLGFYSCFFKNKYPVNLQTVFEKEKEKITSNLYWGIDSIINKVNGHIEKINEEINKVTKVLYNESITKISNPSPMLMSNQSIKISAIPTSLIKKGFIKAASKLCKKKSSLNNILIQTEWFCDDDNMDDQCSLFLFKIIEDCIDYLLENTFTRTIRLELYFRDGFYNLKLNFLEPSQDFSFDQIEKTFISKIEMKIALLQGTLSMYKAESQWHAINLLIPSPSEV